ncbi:MAG: urease accessory protein UreD [Pseudomonadota bacterium]
MSAVVRALPRAIGESRLVLQRRDQQTALKTLYQQGCAKIRFPHNEAHHAHESVLINTAGGLTDGDCLSHEIEWQAGAHAIVTTQAAERVYRSRADDARVDTRLRVGPDARAVWLPQETIMFDGGRLTRRLDVDLQPGASFFAAESVVFGRTAMGECVHSGGLDDVWHICRNERPLFVEHFRADDRLHGDLAKWRAQPVTLAGGVAMLTAVLICDGHEQYLNAVLDALKERALSAGASNLGAALLVRAVSDDASALRDALQQIFFAIQSVDAANNPLHSVAMPRAYFC